MGGERECLSKHILELTEQLATAQTIQSLEIINVRMPPEKIYCS